MFLSNRKIETIDEDSFKYYMNILMPLMHCALLQYRDTMTEEFSCRILIDGFDTVEIIYRNIRLTYRSYRGIGDRESCRRGTFEKESNIQSHVLHCNCEDYPYIDESNIDDIIYGIEHNFYIETYYDSKELVTIQEMKELIYILKENLFIEKGYPAGTL